MKLNQFNTLGFHLFIPFLSVCIIFFSCNKDDGNLTIIESSVEWAMGFPPVVSDEQRASTTPILEELNVSSIRMNEEWRYREPEENMYNWAPLDARVTWAVENDIQILLTIQASGPEWACGAQNDNSCAYTNWNRFQTYIENLIQRYPEGISKIQFGNEWQTDSWYIGSNEEFVRANNIVYNAVQQYNPDITVVLGGFSTTAIAYLAGCDGRIDAFYDHNSIWIDPQTLAQQCLSQEFTTFKERVDYVVTNSFYDELDIHLYDDVENWQIYFDYTKENTSKPIIITEFGGPNLIVEPYTEQYQADQLRNYLNTIATFGVEQAYYFKLWEGSMNPVHEKSGLIRLSDGVKKESFYVFKEFSTN